jgi:FMN phosphatase YigB (HAD superfamily)
VSDIHFDFRPELATLGLDDCVGEFVPPFEHGMQKPDLRILQLALKRLRVKPSATLKVGVSN